MVEPAGTEAELGKEMGAAATTRPTLHLHLSPYANKPELQQRLRKIEGQVRGIERMVEDERYCVDILTQIAAVRAALDRVSLQLLEAHVEGCVSDAIRSGQGEPYIRELMSVFTRLIR